MRGDIELYSAGQLRRIIGKVPHGLDHDRPRAGWRIFFAASLNIERLGEYGEFSTPDAAVLAVVRAYPRERFRVRMV